MDKNQPEKKRGLISKITAGPRWWFRGWKTIGTGVIALDQQKQLFSYTRTSWQQIRRRLNALHQPRDPNAPGAPDMQKFSEVLEHWGITLEQLPLVIRGIKMQIAAYSVLGLASILGLYYGVKATAWWPIVNGGLVFIMCSTVVVARYWRLQVLQSERFFPFKAWVTGKVN